MKIDSKIHERLNKINTELTVIEKQIHAIAIRLDTTLSPPHNQKLPFNPTF